MSVGTALEEEEVDEAELDDFDTRGTNENHTIISH